ncbi:MAG: hypothetical protein LAT65_15205 [Saccharospirillum sp.]|nr:hypothetical protein [Saccharospirillum sp.]
MEGEFNSDGIVVAEEIELRETDTELEGKVSEVNDAKPSLNVGGVRVVVSNSTYRVKPTKIGPDLSTQRME